MPSDPRGAENTLRSMGYTNIQTNGYSMFGCGKDDTFSTKFTAQNPINGKHVSGVVWWLFE